MTSVTDFITDYFSNNHIDENVIVFLATELSTKDQEVQGLKADIRLLESEVNAWREHSNAKSKKLQDAKLIESEMEAWRDHSNAKSQRLRDSCSSEEKSTELVKQQKAQCKQLRNDLISMNDMHAKGVKAFNELQTNLFDLLGKHVHNVCTRCGTCAHETGHEHCKSCRKILNSCPKEVIVRYVTHELLKKVSDISLAYGYGNLSAFPNLVCNMETTIYQLCTMIKQVSNIKKDQKIQLWRFCARKNGPLRPMDHYDQFSIFTLNNVMAEDKCPLIFYVRCVPENEKDYDPENRILICMKEFRHGKLTYDRHQIVNKHRLVSTVQPNKFVNIYDEICRDRIEKLAVSNAFNEEDIHNGDILVKNYKTGNSLKKYYKKFTYPVLNMAYWWFELSSWSMTSGEFVIKDMVWKLKCCLSIKDSKWIAIYLIPRYEKFKRPKRLTVGFTITLMYPDNKDKNVAKTCKSHTFNSGLSADWGFNKFIKTKQFSDFLCKDNKYYWKVEIF